MIFNDSQVQMIKNSINLRIESIENNEKRKTELDNILEKINSQSFHLNSLEKATICGCIKEHEIDPNKDLYNRTEYDLLFINSEIRSDYKRLDIANGLLNKLQRRDQEIQQIFEESFEKIENLKKTKKALFSYTNEGKIYKVALVFNQNKGYRLINSDSHFAYNFELQKKLYKDSFMKTASVSDLIHHIDWYAAKNNLPENLILLKNLCLKLVENG